MGWSHAVCKIICVIYLLLLHLYGAEAVSLNSDAG